MKILAVDIGTGTQDILLFDSTLDVENGYKLIMPSPTMLARRSIRRATAQRSPVVLTGRIMGGGPCAWAVEDHLKAGLSVYATPQAASTLNDDLDAVRALGVQVVDEGEAVKLAWQLPEVRMRDFDFDAIAEAFGAFDVPLHDLDGVAAAVFDHGDAPAQVSDRQFRFDYLDERIRAHNALEAFAFPAEGVPASMTRLHAVAAEAQAAVTCPVVVMDTAPAAVLGTGFDPLVAGWQQRIIANIGNFHTLAFRLGAGGVEGVFEHHTGFLEQPKLERLLRSLAAGTLAHADVFGDQGHGALVYDQTPYELPGEGMQLAVSGPRRGMMRGSGLQPYFAAPFGDMMIAGCFGLLAGAAAHLPGGEEVLAALRGERKGRTPWEE
ncbi:MAG: pyruvate formate lyase-activating protein [Anaerolineae bacterium]|nr:pyruvate formate lyase-activating protein [Anaerolineae bacterium]